jgi:hypothetical protein
MAERKRTKQKTNNGPHITAKKIKIEQHKPNKNRKVNSGAPER